MRRRPPKPPPLASFAQYVAQRPSHTEAAQVVRQALQHLPADLGTWPEVEAWMGRQGHPRHLQALARESWGAFQALRQKHAKPSTPG